VSAWIVRLGRGRGRHFWRDGAPRTACGRLAATISERTDPHAPVPTWLDTHCEFALGTWRRAHPQQVGPDGAGR